MAWVHPFARPYAEMKLVHRARVSAGRRSHGEVRGIPNFQGDLRGLAKAPSRSKRLDKPPSLYLDSLVYAEIQECPLFLLLPERNDQRGGSPAVPIPKGHHAWGLGSEVSRLEFTSR